MSQSDEHPDPLLAEYLRRNKKLQRWTWWSTAVPLAVFVFLSVMAAEQARRYTKLSGQSRELQQKIDKQQAQLKQQEQDLAVKQLAINIVKEQSPGVRPKVVIYRRAIAHQVEAALSELGYQVELSSYQGNPALANRAVDTLEYGCAVTNEDIRTIAAALTKADLAIRRIAPAVLKKDARLIQLIASGKTDPGSTPLSPAEISAWSRSDKPCDASAR